jgi:hypothetical protein
MNHFICQCRRLFRLFEILLKGKYFLSRERSSRRLRKHDRWWCFNFFYQNMSQVTTRIWRTDLLDCWDLIQFAGEVQGLAKTMRSSNWSLHRTGFLLNSLRSMSENSLIAHALKTSTLMSSTNDRMSNFTFVVENKTRVSSLISNHQLSLFTHINNTSLKFAKRDTRKSSFALSWKLDESSNLYH